MKPERIRIGRRGSPPPRTKRARWPFRFTLILLGCIGITVSLFIAYRGEAPGQLPWNVAGGAGTESNPYRIETCAQLQNLSFAPEAAYALARDIDCADHASLNAGRGFTPIGTTRDGFTGTLDGKGFAIRNLVMDRPSEDAVALFSLLGSGASVSRLVLHVSVTGRDSVGGLAGWMDDGALVSDLTVTGRVKGRLSVGGVAGVNRGIIRSVTVGQDRRGSATGGTTVPPSLSSDVAVTGIRGVGGIAGIADDGGRIEHTTVSGTVTGEEDVGGVAGVGRGVLIDGCTVTGTVRGTRNTGGAVGWLMGGAGRASSVVDCRFAGTEEGMESGRPLIGKRGIPEPNNRDSQQ
ncbi:MAG: GLUG motif-containing protein [Candidatus Peribacter sp.]|jgi:hypothetical protein